MCWWTFSACTSKYNITAMHKRYKAQSNFRQYQVNSIPSRSDFVSSARLSLGNVSNFRQSRANSVPSRSAFVSSARLSLSSKPRINSRNNINIALFQVTYRHWIQVQNQPRCKRYVSKVRQAKSSVLFLTNANCKLAIV